MFRKFRLRELFVAYLFVSVGSIIWLVSTCGPGAGCMEGGDKDSHLEYYIQELERARQNVRKTEKKIQTVSARLNEHYPRAAESIEEILGISSPRIPTIYAVMPTYTRPVQKAELTRLSQTFRHLRNFHWIMVEDAEQKTPLVERFLATCGLPYTHLNIKTTDEYKLKPNEPSWRKPRGVDQRNLAIEWILDNVPEDGQGVVYFADDDNTYSLKLFEEMRSTQRVSVWPVGLVGGLRLEKPILDDNGRVASWYTSWEPNRMFALDMAGFAVNLRLLRQNPHARFDIMSKRGHVETSLLTQLGVQLSDLEPKADKCTKVLVWHTRTENPKWKNEDKLIALGKPSFPMIEV